MLRNKQNILVKQTKSNGGIFMVFAYVISIMFLDKSIGIDPVFFMGSVLAVYRQCSGST